MKILIRAALITILILGLPVNQGMTERVILKDDSINLIAEGKSTLERDKDTELVDPYFSDSEKIIKKATEDCKGSFSAHEQYRDFCICAGKRTAEFGRKPSPQKDHGECHYKLMLAAGMLRCDIFISNERQKRQIKKLFDLMLDEVKAGACLVK